jgi:aminodeoxyfutalosine synthase
LREVHIVGGLYSKWSFDDYLNVLRVIRQSLSSHIQLKAYTAVEIDYFRSQRKNAHSGNCSNGLKDEGLVCLPGGGAEIFSERVRKALVSL